MAIAIEPAQIQSWLQPLYQQLGSILIGQTHLVQRMLIGLIADGHLLIEGLPGLAKTLAAKSLADCLHLQMKRIQFTPDLLPADLIGTQIYQPQSGQFSIRQGPLFTHVILADEINRASAKVQSALLEAMQERQVTIGDTTFPLPNPFIVLATQNPLDQEGTYPLPEAQLDRFLLKVLVTYPTLDEERTMLQRHGSIQAVPRLTPVLNLEQLLQIRAMADAVHMDAKIEEYVLAIVRRTREPKLAKVENWLEVGASPRAGIALKKCAKAKALLAGRAFTLPEDVKELAADVLRHRLIRTFEAEAEGVTVDQILQKILQSIPVP